MADTWHEEITPMQEIDMNKSDHPTAPLELCECGYRPSIVCGTSNCYQSQFRPASSEAKALPCHHSLPHEGCHLPEHTPPTPADGLREAKAQARAIAFTLTHEPMEAAAFENRVDWIAERIDSVVSAAIDKFIAGVENSQANCKCVCGWYEEMKALAVKYTEEK